MGSDKTAHQHGNPQHELIYLLIKIKNNKLSVVQMVRFIMMELIHSSLNLRFDVGDAYLWLIIFLVICTVSIDSDVLLDRFCKSQDHTDPIFQKFS
jgi:hypothetical protein